MVYKYQTAINKTCRQAIASSMPAVTLIASIFRLSCDVAIASDSQAASIGREKLVNSFEKELFPIKTFNMAMKLVIWIAQSNKEMNKPAVRELLIQRLPRSIINEACRAKGKDKKLVWIGDYLADLIHGQANAN